MLCVSFAEFKPGSIKVICVTILRLILWSHNYFTSCCNIFGVMHTDLSSHLHTHECNELIIALSKCHDENPFQKFIGACNSIDTQMVKCLKRERLRRRQKNYEESIVNRAAIKARVLADMGLN